MKNAVIYLMKDYEDCFEEEEKIFKEDASKIRGIKVIDVYLEETSEDREKLYKKLYDKVNKGEVQIILTNNFAFPFFVERENKLLADKINESDIDIFVRTNLSFDGSEELTALAFKES